MILNQNQNLKAKTLSGMAWMFFERVGSQLMSFIVSIVLARLLLPEQYGVIAIVMVFINICNVFVTSGLGQALIQKKEADEKDFSSVFYLSFFISIILYVGLFFSAPLIAKFYDMEILSPVLRVLGIQLIISSFNGIQRSKVSKEMRFKKFFYSTIIGTLTSAVVGIIMAYNGFGVWALVAQQLSNIIVNTIVLFVTVKWYPKLYFSFKRAKVLFSYSWKILVGSLIDTVYEDFRSLYVVKLYSATDLAYYTRGRQFPNLIVSNINSSISGVLFPAISSQQDDKDKVKAITRRSIKTSSYVLTPILCGLAAVAEPLVRLVLTEKWLPCVPFLQILCFNSVLLPLQTANVQAIYAVGRSDIALKLNVFKKTFGFLMILIFARISIIAMAWAGVLTGVVSLIANATPNKKLFSYGFFEQILDIIPHFILSGIMMLGVWAVSFLPIQNVLLELIIMVVCGAVTYLFVSWLFKVESFNYILDTIKGFLSKRKGDI